MWSDRQSYYCYHSLQVCLMLCGLFLAVTQLYIVFIDVQK
ncbi:putative membrane protein [Escherichia coli 2-156-04_S3_C2]|nr:putative membrane protein [Escherichia coli 2-156-04_S3_C2]